VSFHDPWDLLEDAINIDAVFQAQILEHRYVVKDNPDNPERAGNYAIENEIFLAGVYLKHYF